VITCSNQFDLGRDKTRIKDPRDAERQTRTVDAILERFFNAKSSERFEIQILADEVGMGKTFVALGVAYSILAHLKTSRIESDLDGCYQRVLVLTPNNHALFKKWVREVAEFTRRCVLPKYQEQDLLFAPQPIDRLDDLAVQLRKGNRQPQVVVARMGLFGGDRLLDYDLKRRFLLGVLFRYWGVRFNYEQRERLLRGAPEGWPRRPDALTQVEEWEDERLPFDEEQLLNFLQSFNREDSQEVEALLELCREVAVPYFRERDDAFRKIETRLISIYRLATNRSIQRDFPLLIVDEAHNWKNGPEAGTNGFADFSKFIAPHVRRALLLTATPFQLRPEEMLEILKVSDFMEPCALKEASRVRVERLKKFREQTIKPVLRNAESHSHTFSRAWVRIPSRITTEDLENAWAEPSLIGARKKLSSLAAEDGAITSHENELRKTIEGALAGIDPDVRHFLREALYLHAYNADLSCEMGRLVMRHRRRTEHRLFRVGMEYEQPWESIAGRPDGHVLHSAPGLDVKGEAELPQYLLMRCVSEMKRGKGRSSLGSDLTGCYSTLHESAEGRKVKESLKDSPSGKLYLDLLMDMVAKRHDPKHPKLERVVHEVLERWRSGEKVLIFCFRINTAERLREIIADTIGEELKRRRKRCLGGEEQLKSLRSRLTGRDRDLVVLGLDRVLWSVVWGADARPRLNPEEFILSDDELTDLARLGLLFGVDLQDDRLDRVFLNRAIEHILARRLLRENQGGDSLRTLLKRLAQESWVANPYGLDQSGDEDEQGEEAASFDERGCHTIYSAGNEPSPAKVAAFGKELAATRQTARTAKQMPRLDAYGLAPSLWLGPAPQKQISEGSSDHNGNILKFIHEHLWKLTWPAKDGHPGDDSHGVDDDGFDFYSRALVFQALRRALLRESVLLRLLPERSDLDQSSWGELLSQAFFNDLPHQHESMADRVGVFLEDLHAASGSVRNPESARGAFYGATRLRDQQFVALVKGGGGRDTRDRIFNGFNTPLLPEILICTSVGQEGIDLHRHCRHVVHYDLAWNPAVLEQRTGRADRIGSKTFRERNSLGDASKVFLDIGVPFLAGTYDERMYEELKMRAQTFEVLTGGDFAADHADGQDDDPKACGKELGVTLVPLPVQMVKDLRVHLEVWTDDTNE